MAIKTMGVVGAGQMGGGIAQVAASSGFEVIMSDIKDEFVERGKNAIAKSLDRFVKKGKLTQENRDETMGRITGTSDLSMMKNADFVVEAATENEGLKLGIFKQLDGLCGGDVILASNTSSISITRIAGA
ncbi:MAG: 3-hydroxybutyryl-CoA dehydrogenase, partial [Nitrospiraceae bacterium]|nr:3-hydroxybutyryl-CoA dehydrogenase [Nitrospiraceae bacterium]